MKRERKGGREGRERGRGREGEGERGREREKEGGRGKERERERGRGTKREGERERERKREGERGKGVILCVCMWKVKENTSTIHCTCTVMTCTIFYYITVCKISYKYT